MNASPTRILFYSSILFLLFTSCHRAVTQTEPPYSQMSTSSEVQLTIIAVASGHRLGKVSWLRTSTWSGSFHVQISHCVLHVHPGCVVNVIPELHAQMKETGCMVSRRRDFRLH